MDSYIRTSGILSNFDLLFIKKKKEKDVLLIIQYYVK